MEHPDHIRLKYAELQLKHLRERKALLDSQDAVRTRLKNKHRVERLSLGIEHYKEDFQVVVTKQIAEIRNFYKARKTRYLELLARQDLQIGAFQTEVQKQVESQLINLLGS